MEQILQNCEESDGYVCIDLNHSDFGDKEERVPPESQGKHQEVALQLHEIGAVLVFVRYIRLLDDLLGNEVVRWHISQVVSLHASSLHFDLSD